VGVVVAVAAQLARTGVVAAQVAGDPDQPRDPTAANQPSTRSAGWLDWSLPVALVAGTLAVPTPDECRWCDRDGLGRETLNGFDRSVRASLRWSDTRPAGRLSSVTVVAPLAFLVGLDRDRLKETVLPVFQAFGTTYAITHVVKAVAARERPSIHFGGGPSPSGNASFFSGHTSAAFSVVFALARVTSDRDDRRAKWIWLTGVPLAAATGYLRVAADEHYITDVLSGAAVGASVGWWGPSWWGSTSAGDAGPSISPAALPGGAGLSVSLRW
jgi:hypothetical protein